MQRDNIFETMVTAARWHLKTLPQKFLDWLFNVQSNRVVFLSELEKGDKVAFPVGAKWYEATPWFTLSRILSLCDQDFSKYTFVDFGCGKGRILVEARAISFADIIGIDYSPSLCAIAKINLAHARLLPTRTLSVTALCMDVELFEFPSTPCVLYFYNPFDEQVMRRIADRLTRSIKDNPRDVIVIFFSAIKNAGCFSTDAWRVVHDRTLRMLFAETRKFVILQSRPS